MMTEIKAVIARSSTTLIEDAAGVVALFVLLMAGLYLPGFA